MRTSFARLLLLPSALMLLAACGRDAPAPATPLATAPAAASVTTVGDATLQVSAIAIANLNDAVATRYGLDRRHDGALLLVTLRDANGNAIPPGDLRLTATATVLPDPPKPLELQPIVVEGMTDYIGVFPARPPASVQFRVTAVRNGARAEIATSADLYPR
ncbi:DUF4426 domain-containing protein [Thermomonas paludicola]|uniref:DUF4426 domain-containing protein n=1 Tax=Thermomonas paludicola TaxID=2884874 RepID=UPI00211500F7|nr:DUF4426 domain-containing protein [Thermomonas paludicola]